ncbi:hypothetical protein BH10PSE3_BH10PSE3_25770 [soil metagenome]
MVAVAMGLAGCVDDSTGKWMGPVAFATLATQDAHGPAAPAPPPEWQAICKTAFEIQRSPPPPKPDGLLVSSAPPAIALALRRSGATYAAAHVSLADAALLAPLIREAGVYRIRRREPSADCDARLDAVIRRSSAKGAPWTSAAQCLSAEKIGPYVDLDAQAGSPAAPYVVRGLTEARDLGPDFRLTLLGQAVVDRATGREIARRMGGAQLAWRVPDVEPAYWRLTQYCSPGLKTEPAADVLAERLFAPI